MLFQPEIIDIYYSSYL